MAKSKRVIFLLLLLIITSLLYIIPKWLISYTKDRIRNYLEKSLETDIDIGRVDINLFTASIILEDLTIENLLKVNQVLIKPGLKQLLKKKFVISKIVLDKPILSFNRLITGKTNWDSIWPKGHTKGMGWANEFLIKDGRFIYTHELNQGKTAAADFCGIFLHLKNYPSPISHIQDVPLFTRIRGRGYIPTIPKGVITFSGNLNLFEAQKSFQGNISMDNISLTYFNNFYPENSQIQVISGEFLLKTKAECIHDQLIARPDTTVRNLQLKLTKDYTTGDVFELPGVLVVDFFDIYREELKFTFEVSGTLSNPEFKLEQVVSQQVSEVIGASILRTIAASPTLIVRLGDKLVTIADKLKEFGFELGKGTGKALEQLGKPAKELIKGLKGE